MKKCIITAALAGLALVPTCWAEFIPSADGKYFSDTRSGKDWLSLNLTKGLSYQQVSRLLTKGGQFEGWRYADPQEFNQLVMHSTAVEFHPNYEGTKLFSDGMLENLIGLFGITFERDKAAIGMTSQGFSRNYRDTAALIADAPFYRNQDISHAVAGMAYISQNDPKVGSFLVRDSNKTTYAEYRHHAKYINDQGQIATIKPNRLVERATAEATTLLSVSMKFSPFNMDVTVFNM